MARDADASDEPVGKPAAAPYAAWLRYLTSLGENGDCAMAASLAYRSLPTPARSAWLDALEVDAPGLDVEPFALYAPLLAVEHDLELGTRIRAAMGELPITQVTACALSGVDGEARVAVLVRPAYLDFVDLVGCRYSPDEGIALAVREPLRRWDELPSAWNGIALEAASLDAVIEDLAHAVLADRRLGKPPPEALIAFADLFAPRAP